ncbi:MAG: NUDIX domain-containing protein [Planctomycetota bacterium]|nr:MAG: NUDIX domain-containing protein [Planctomycetota bacterium]
MAEPAGKIVPVVLVAVERGGSDEFLLIRRREPPFVGLWGMPGGKIRPGEHPADAAGREILEETGCSLTNLRCLGTVSEFLIEAGVSYAHLMIHLFRASTADEAVSESREGELSWRARKTIVAAPPDMIPSDVRMLSDILLPEKPAHAEVHIEKEGGRYRLTRFEKTSG